MTGVVRLTCSIDMGYRYGEKQDKKQGSPSTLVMRISYGWCCPTASSASARQGRHRRAAAGLRLALGIFHMVTLRVLEEKTMVISATMDEENRWEEF